ncbi:MAG: dehydrogenase, partial [Pseudomonadota bacterium]
MEERADRSICQFCHTNCGIIVRRGAGNAISVEGDPDHPVNRGRCCPKSAAIPEVIRSRDRLRHPLRKTSKGFER